MGYCIKGVRGERKIRTGKGKESGGTDVRSIGQVESSTSKFSAII